MVEIHTTFVGLHVHIISAHQWLTHWADHNDTGEAEESPSPSLSPTPHAGEAAESPSPSLPPTPSTASGQCSPTDGDDLAKDRSS